MESPEEVDTAGTAGVDAESVAASARGGGREEEENNEDEEEGENYYAEFDRLTKALYENIEGGQVLCDDLSAVESLPNLLTAPEKAARRSWNAARTSIKKLYKGKDRKVVDTQNKFLEERVVPPLFTINDATTRNKAATRDPRNPPEIFEWDDFEANADSFIPVNGDEKFSEESIDLDELKVFEISLGKKKAVRGETNEEEFHGEYVLANLRVAGLLSFSEDQDVARHGLPDYILHQGTTAPRVAIAYKATHNLPLPMKAVDIVQRYANGRPGLSQERSEQQERDKERVCDTLGQLFRYMVANGIRHGALTSASRTYFCFFDDDDDDGVANKVCVSDAWFLGQENYLRAWAYLWSLSTNSARRYDSEDVEWNHSDAEFMPNQEDNDDDDDDNTPAPSRASRRPRPSSGGASRSCLYSVNIPIVSFRSIQFLGPLGYGRNGCVFHAHWEQKPVAVKQFDVARPGVLERFCKEKYAYEVLRDVQGILIPKALFVAESSAGIIYFGLQLGRKPGKEDDISGLPNVLKALKSQFGFCHEDHSSSNCLLIPCGGGKEKLVAIDLEDYKWEKVEKQRIWGL